MRQVVLDTETTGLDPNRGHRVIEIGGVELFNRQLSGRRFHRYLQPDREIDPGAFEVHGISESFLKGQPRFEDVAGDFLSFIDGAELIIHNADFDIAFLDYELSLLVESQGRLRIRNRCTVLDTLAFARKLHPGQRNSLDALCKRYRVDNSQRELHGALLDAEILAELYLAMTRGQESLDLGTGVLPARSGFHRPDARRRRPPLRVIRSSPEELDAHRRRLQAIEESSGGHCLWIRLETSGTEEGTERNPAPARERFGC